MSTNVVTGENVNAVTGGSKPAKLGILEKFSYGLGDFASNLMWGIIGSFLLYFYTDVALIPVAATGTIMLVARIFDAVIDPVIGGFVDRTHTKWGQTKPYILFGIVPLSVMLVLTFYSPDVSNTWKIVYALVTYLVLGLLYSIVNIPYGALMPLMTRNTDEKSVLSSFRMGGMALGNIFVTACTTPLVVFFGGGSERQGYLLTSVLFAVLGLILFMIVYKNCQERYVLPPSSSKQREKGELISTYKSAFRNGPWITTVLFALMLFIKLGSTVAITIFFCINVLHNPAMISVLLPLMYVAVAVSSFFTPMVLKRFKHRTSNIISLSLYSIGLVIMYFFIGNNTMLIAMWFIANICGAITSGSVFGMTADSVDYNEWKFNKRSEGTLYAGYSFSTKVGMAIGGAVVSFSLAIAGYHAAEVTPAVENSIKILFFAIPIVLSVLQIIIVMFYKLDKLHPQIVRELEQRNANA